MDRTIRMEMVVEMKVNLDNLGTNVTGISYKVYDVETGLILDGGNPDVVETIKERFIETMLNSED